MTKLMVINLKSLKNTLAQPRLGGLVGSTCKVNINYKTIKNWELPEEEGSNLRPLASQAMEEPLRYSPVVAYALILFSLYIFLSRSPTRI